MLHHLPPPFTHTTPSIQPTLTANYLICSLSPQICPFLSPEQSWTQRCVEDKRFSSLHIIRWCVFYSDRIDWCILAWSIPTRNSLIVSNVIIGLELSRIRFYRTSNFYTITNCIVSLVIILWNFDDFTALRPITDWRKVSSQNERKFTEYPTNL